MPNIRSTNMSGLENKFEKAWILLTEKSAHFITTIDNLVFRTPISLHILIRDNFHTPII